jgi:CubicO group peptidase (beta-lactamase class C family)
MKLNIKKFEKYAYNIISKYQIPGMAIGINKNGMTLYKRGFGYRDLESYLPVTMNTVFGVASITKSLTCMSIMQLQERGKLSVLEPVNKYLPEFLKNYQNKGRIKIHHLMTHSSGLPPLSTFLNTQKKNLVRDPSYKDYPGLNIDDNLDKVSSIESYDELIEFISGLKINMLGEPGEVFSYSNESFALLGAIIERVSGISYEEYVKKNILEPTGMNNSGFTVDEINSCNITSLYASRKINLNNYKVYKAPIWWDSHVMSAAGSLKSTVNDLLNYIEIFRNNGLFKNHKIISRDSVKAMETEYIECTPEHYYGYGLIISQYHDEKILGHGGSLKGISSQWFMIPETGLSAVILVNLAGCPAKTTLLGAINAVENQNEIDPLPVLNKSNINLTEVKEYTGVFASEEGMKLIIYTKNGQLKFLVQGNEFPIYPFKRDIWVAIIRDERELIKFVRGDTGKIKYINFHLRRFPKICEAQN